MVGRYRCRSGKDRTASIGDCVIELSVLNKERMQMKVLRVLDSSGDRLLMFDGTEASAQARAEAQELFERLLANGFHRI